MSLHDGTVVPTEIIRIILDLVGTSREQRAVLRAVCSLWHRLLPAPDPGPMDWTSLAATGHLSLLLFLFPFMGDQHQTLCRKLAAAGLLTELQWARAQGCRWDILVFAAAAGSGNLALLEYLYAMQCPADGPVAVRAAARHGHRPVLEWLAARCGVPVRTNAALEEAAAGGHVELVKWLCLQAPLSDEDFHHGLIVSNSGHRDLALWAASLPGAKLSPDDLGGVVERGDMVTMQALLAQHPGVYRLTAWDDHLMAYAALGGHIAMMAFLREHGCPWNSWVTEFAARANHLAALQWLHAHGCPFWLVTQDGKFGQVWKDALRGRGDRALLQWLKDLAPLPPKRGEDTELTWFAAERSDLALLQWLVEELGCGIGPDTFAKAARHGNLPMLKWLVSKGCVIGESAVANAVIAGRRDIVAWLLMDLNIPVHRSLCPLAASCGHLSLLAWLHEVAQHALDVRVCDAAVANGHLNVLQWALARQCPVHASMLVVAQDAQQYDVVRWLEARLSANVNQ